jgi:HD-like signal output (HDOD) protein
MLSAFQRRWGIDQWVAYLKDKEIPVLPETRDALAALRKEEEDRIAPKDIAAVVLCDPFLALKLLRRVEGHRSATLGQETTTALASVLQAGVDDLMRTVNDGSLVDESRAGMQECIAHTVVAARIARAWASLRADVSAEEVALAALLAESGELLLWHFAPELPQNALDELHSGRAHRTLQAQQQTAGFSFRQMTLTLVEGWALPRLIAQLIRGSDTLRANIARQAGDTARHLVTDPENPALPADLVNIRRLIPGSSYHALLAHLPVSEEYKEQVLQALAEDNYTQDLQ